MLRLTREGRTAGSNFIMRHVVDMVKRFGIENKYVLCADGQVDTCMYKYKLV